MDVFNLLVEKYCEMPKGLRRPMWQVWHKLIIKFDKKVTANFMNYGYSSLNGEEQISLEKNDEVNRFCIQLYDRVVREGQVEKKNVLEVGSGRGGGASYITRYYSPESYTALDISSSVIDFCNRHYDIPGLSFVRGYAEDLPFDDHSFDRVVNVESARCYSNINTFFQEVNRVLDSDGYFLFADMIEPDELKDIESKLEVCGFEIIDKKNITENVVRGLEKDSKRREGMIKDLVPGFLKNSFAQFAGTKGTERYNSFTNGKFEYWYFRLKKLK